MTRKTYSFRCLECGQTVIVPLRAGPRPQFCSPACRIRLARRRDPAKVPRIREIRRLQAEVASLQAEVRQLRDRLAVAEGADH